MRERRKKWAAQVAAVSLAAVCAAAVAEAQQAPDAQKPAPETPKPSGRHGVSRTDSQGNVIPVIFAADEVTYDDPLGVIIARGNVEISQAGQTVLADVVAYNTHTDTVTASGHVTIIRATGETVSAEYADLTNQLNDGFIQDIRMLLADRSRMVGNTARRTGNGNRTEIRRGVYSPCDLCKDDPNAPPVWQLRADTIIHNKEQQLVEYKDATLDIDGFPVFYSPYLSHPDPSVRRSSGLLPITPGESSQLGAFVKIPYYWVIDESSDATFEPMFTTSQGPVLEGEYRKRFADGQIYFQGSLTQGSELNLAGVTKQDQTRGNIDTWGQFDIDDNLRVGFVANRTTDQTYLQVYRLGGTDAFLRSRAYLEDFEGRDYGVVNAYDFQSLRYGVSDRTQPIALPDAEYTWAGAPMSWGGKFTTTVSGNDLLRESGSSARRVSAESQFDLPFFGPWGERFNFVGGLRGDAYDVAGVQLTTAGTRSPLFPLGPLVNQVVPTGPQVSGYSDRVFPQVGLEWNWPWITRGSRGSFTIEPRVAFYAAPNGGNPAKIADNDSQAFEFNDTDLFTRNRMSGYDQVDSGQRIDYGIQGSWNLDTGQTLSFLTGQSYRFEKQSPFAGQNYTFQPNGPSMSGGTGDGLVRQASDYVGRIVYSPSQSVDLLYRYRFDEQDLRPMRQEIGIGTGTETFHVNLGLLQLGDNYRDIETHREQISLGLNVQFDQYWSASASGTRDLAGDGLLVSSGVGLQYSDECMTFITSFTTYGIRIGNFQPSQALTFNLVLKNLGVITLPAVSIGGLQ
jgi:LPS-assembly protein